MVLHTLPASSNAILRFVIVKASFAYQYIEGHCPILLPIIYEVAANYKPATVLRSCSIGKRKFEKLM